MNRKNQHNTRILTLKAESEIINHEEKFRDSRRGNRELNKRLKWLKELNNHNNNYQKANINYKVNPFKILYSIKLNKLTVQILHK